MNTKQQTNEVGAKNNKKTTYKPRANRQPPVGSNINNVDNKTPTESAPSGLDRQLPKPPFKSNKNNVGKFSGTLQSQSGFRHPFNRRLRDETGPSNGVQNTYNNHRYQRNEPCFRKNVNKMSNKTKERTTHYGIQRTDSQEVCILCCQPSDLFGIGNCKHVACMECTIRMRCLGETINCFACRDLIPTLYFVRRPKDVDWSTYTVPECKMDHPDSKKYNIAFEDAYTVQCYEKYNSFSCTVCTKNSVFADFPTFAALKLHMGTHHLLFCHVCLENNLNILPKDHQTFTGAELTQHMTGERNIVAGIRGHPECRFCHLRFFDEEELYKHSRREHFFCSLCAQNVGKNLFFNRVDQLHKHYKIEHHPCLEVGCVEAGIVFMDNFALNLHKAEVHSGGADRKVHIVYEFTRGPTRYASPTSRRLNQTSGVTMIPSNHPTYQPTSNIIPSAQFSGQEVNLVPRASLLERDEADFPLLGPSESASQIFQPGSSWRTNLQASKNQRNDRKPVSMQAQLNSNSHFPSLGGNAPSSSCESAANVWKRSNIAEKLKQPFTEQNKPKKPEPEEPRKRIIPLPEVWPPHMQRDLKARETGQPQSPLTYPPLPSVPLENKKKKEPKKKTVSSHSVQNKLNSQNAVSTTSHKSVFGALAASDAPADDTALDAWLSSSAMKAKQKKAEKKKAEKVAREEEKRKVTEENEKISNKRLTYEQFLAEKAEEMQKKEEAEKQRLADEQLLETYGRAQQSENFESDCFIQLSDSEDSTNDPVLKMLMQNFHLHSSSTLTNNEKRKARFQSLLGEHTSSSDVQSLIGRPSNSSTNIGQERCEDNTAIQQLTPTSSEEDGNDRVAASSGFPAHNTKKVVTPPPGFEWLKPPGIEQTPPGFH